MTEQLPIVFLIDDDPAVLTGVARVLRAKGFNVLPFASPYAFKKQFDPTVTGCIVLDIAMPELDGLRLQKDLTAIDCNLPIIFLTGHGDIPSSVRAIRQGAVEFLTKPADKEVLASAVRLALERDRQLRPLRLEAAQARQCFDSLTDRERDVLRLVIQGKLNKQIANELGTALTTIKVHRGRVMKKMHARSVVDLVRTAQWFGLSAPSLPPPSEAPPDSAGTPEYD